MLCHRYRRDSARISTLSASSVNFEKRIGAISKKISPSFIIDVGVAFGTPTLYDLFPGSGLVLVEPNPEFHDYLEDRLLKSRSGVLFKCAASMHCGNALLKKKHDGSSLAKPGGAIDGDNAIEVNLATLDSLTHQILSEKTTAVLKTDCQGHDYAVLLGASNTLQYCELVIVETLVYPWEGSEKNSLLNIVSIMKQFDFVLYDILEPLYRPFDSALAQVDAVFVPKGSSLVSFQGF